MQSPDVLADATAKTASDVMTPFAIAVQPETLLVDAVSIMLDRKIRHLPVVDTSSAIIGILSDRDVRTAVGDPRTFVAQHAAATHGLRVLHLMRRSPTTIVCDLPFREIIRHLVEGGHGALPVTDRFGALIGIVSYVDILRHQSAAS